MKRVLSVRRVGTLLAGISLCAIVAIAVELHWFIGRDPMAGLEALDRGAEFTIDLGALHTPAATVSNSPGIADLFGKPQGQVTPAAELPPDTPAATPETPLTLRGVILTEGAAIALIEEGGSAELQHLQIGDEISGWRLMGVKNNSIELEHGVEKRVLWLADENSGDGSNHATD
jgi:hypothetical protein